MKRNLFSFLIIIICILVMAYATLSVAATNGDGVGDGAGASSDEASSSQESFSSESSSEESSSSESSSVEGGDSSSESSSENAESSSSDGSSSEEGTESTESSSEETGSEGEEDTSSSSTSSKKPITSVGAGGGSTFVDETDPNVSLPQVTSKVESSDEQDTPGNIPGTDDFEGEDYDEGETISMASRIYNVIWIPIVISLICIGALIYVNVAFRKKFGEVKSQKKVKRTANRRKKSSRRK